MGRSEESYTALKTRVKVVATELKERRAECRTLGQQVGELTETNEQLQTQIINLQSQLSDRDRSDVEAGEEMDQLRARLSDLEEQVKATERRVKEQKAQGDKALAAYKKKAQSNLAVANARTAAAQQAKEEAEMESAAAKKEAEQAVERARVAETGGKNAMAEAKEYVKDLEQQTNTLQQELQTSEMAVRRLEETLKLSQQDVESSRTAREKQQTEMSLTLQELQRERNKTSALQQQVSDGQSRSNQLYDEVETLRDELRKTATAALMAKSDSGKSADAARGDAVDATSSLAAAAASQTVLSSTTEKSKAESTIVMLQGELRDANEAIRELKETLRSALEQQQEQQQQQQPQTQHHHANGGGSLAPQPLHPGAIPAVGGGPGNDSTPLFYALEKQAELKTAQNEINRLANLLGDAESAKMEAYDAMDDMRRQMEEAEARLARYEKLGPTRRKKLDSSKTSSFGGYTRTRPALRSDDDTRSVDSVDTDDDLGLGGGATSSAGGGGGGGNSAQVNLEYLKNVMLSFLNAKTAMERKALVPVVSAVLCLTPEEQMNAMKSVTESGSVENVGLSLFETIGSQVQGLKF